MFGVDLCDSILCPIILLSEKWRTAWKARRNHWKSGPRESYQKFPKRKDNGGKCYKTKEKEKEKEKNNQYRKFSELSKKRKRQKVKRERKDVSLSDDVILSDDDVIVPEVMRRDKLDLVRDELRVVFPRQIRTAQNQRLGIQLWWRHHESSSRNRQKYHETQTSKQ